MVDSIAATSLLGHRPVFGENLIRDVSGTRKSLKFPPAEFLGGRVSVSLPLPKSKQDGFLLSSSIKAHVVHLSTQAKPESIANLTKNLTKGSMTITKHLLSKPEFKEENVVFSPLSLQIALSILAAGYEGPTQHNLISFLGSKSMDELNSLYSHFALNVLSDAAPAGGPRLSSANSFWVEETLSLSLSPSFKEIVATDLRPLSHHLIS